jgi:hypothetical protein
MGDERAVGEVSGLKLPEVLDQHQVRAFADDLRVQDGLAVGGDGEVIALLE